MTKSSKKQNSEMDEILANFYTNLITAILKVYNKSEKLDIQTTIVKRIFNWMIREYKNRVKLYISGKANEYAKTLNLDLTEYKRSELHALLGKNKDNLPKDIRKKLNIITENEPEPIFHMEHILPVSQIIDNLFNAKDNTEIMEVLDDITIAWITRKQQIELDSKMRSGNSRGKNLKEVLENCSDFLKDKFTEIGDYKNYYKTKIINNEDEEYAE